MGSNPIVASMSDERVGVSLDSEMIEGYNSIPIRPAYCRLWRIKASITLTMIIIVLAIFLGMIVRVLGLFGVEQVNILDVVSAFGDHVLDVLISVPIILIIFPPIIYYFVARGLYIWLYERS